MAKKTPTPDGKDTNATRHLGPKAKDDEAVNPYPFLLPATEPGEIGRVGHYRVLHLLGAGGMGMVFAAEDIALRRHVAIKVMHPDLAADPSGGWQRFLREARALGGVKHQNLVTVYQAFQDRGTVFLVMELLQGESLDARIHALEPIKLPEILQIGWEIAEGLAALHEAGLIHRDIKPANIWLETIRKSDKKSGAAPFQVKILDLGLVRNVEEQKGLTATGMVMGTPAYMSLEQVRGQPLDFRTDLFSLGCVLYAVCTGRPPFAAEDPVAQAAALVKGKPIPVSELNSTIPEALSDLIMKLVAKKPEDRPASASEVAELLRSLRSEPEPRQQTQQSPQQRKQEPPPKPKSSGRTEAIYKPEPAPSVARKTVPIELSPDTQNSPASGKSSRRLKKSKGKKKKSFMKRHGLTLIASLWLLIATVLVAAVLGRGDKSTSNTTEPDTTKPDKPPVVNPGKTGDIVYLSEFPKAKVETRMPPFVPPDFDGTIRVGTRVSKYGLFMHPTRAGDSPSQMTFTLGREFSKFNAEVALNNTGEPSPRPVRFTVYLDGKKDWESGPVDRATGIKSCERSVKGVDKLTLEVAVDGDERGVHAAWIDPRVTK